MAVSALFAVKHGFSLLSRGFCGERGVVPEVVAPCGALQLDRPPHLPPRAPACNYQHPRHCEDAKCGQTNIHPDRRERERERETFRGQQPGGSCMLLCVCGKRRAQKTILVASSPRVSVSIVLPSTIACANPRDNVRLRAHTSLPQIPQERCPPSPLPAPSHNRPPPHPEPFWEVGEETPITDGLALPCDSLCDL
jgi:hypothetical protein